MRPDTFAGTPAVRPQDEERPSPTSLSNTRGGEGRPASDQDVKGERSDVPGSGPTPQGRPAAPCSEDPWNLDELELGRKAAQCLGTENQFGWFMAKVVITARAIKAGHVAAVRP